MTRFNQRGDVVINGAVLLIIVGLLVLFILALTGRI